jgi:[protein-PII] uridylyltransferase
MRDARRFCRRHGLPRDDEDARRFLVEHHLTMSRVAQKQDVYEPAVVQSFAEQAGTSAA